MCKKPVGEGANRVLAGPSGSRRSREGASCREKDDEKALTLDVLTF